MTSIHDKRKPNVVAYGTSGLRNLGNTCYMNAPLQCLGTLDLLRTWFIEDKFKSRLETNKEKIKKESLTLKLSELYKHLWLDHTTVSPKSLKALMGTISETFKGNDQQDSHELLNTLLDTVHEEVCAKVKIEFRNIPEMVEQYMIFMDAHEIKSEEDKKEDNDDIAKFQMENREIVTIYNAYKYWEKYVSRSHSIVTDLFTGLYYSSIKCVDCGNITDSFEPFTILSLPINENGNSTLEECLKEFTKEEILDNDNKIHCGKCKKNVIVHKKMYIWEPPPILIIQLKRCKHVTNLVTHQHVTSKIFTKVTYPFEGLNLKDYMTGLHNVKGTNYKLCAVSNHSGKTWNAGHYFAYCKNTINEKWYKYDDDDVYFVPDDKIKKDVMNEDSYLLFYVKE